eukprot:gene268-278_t
MFPEPFHIVVYPLSTAFYNLFALTGIVPALEAGQDKKKHHHLRYRDPVSDMTVHSPAPPAVDPVVERRRAKAMKLLDAKMMELSKVPEGWEDGEDVDDEGVAGLDMTASKDVVRV